MDLGIVVSVQVDAARCNDQSSCIQNLFGIAAIQTANFGDLATLDADIRLVTRHTCPIDNGTVFNNSVEFGHDFLLNINLLITMKHLTGCCQELPTSSTG